MALTDQEHTCWLVPPLGVQPVTELEQSELLDTYKWAVLKTSFVLYDSKKFSEQEQYLTACLTHPFVVQVVVGNGLGGYILEDIGDVWNGLEDGSNVGLGRHGLGAWVLECFSWEREKWLENAEDSSQRWLFMQVATILFTTEAQLVSKEAGHEDVSVCRKLWTDVFKYNPSNECLVLRYMPGV